MNFLHLTTFYPPYSFGGDAMYIYRLAHALGDEGHQVDVIHCIDSYHMQHPDEPEIKFAEHPNVNRHGLKSPLGWLSPLATHQTGRSYLKNRQIREVLNSKPYDVIHFHNISLLGPDIMTIKPAAGNPIKLYTTHEHWLVCPTHVLWKFNKRACEKPECLRCTIMARRPPQLWRYTGMLDRTSRHVDRFVSPSKFTSRMHAERGFSQPVDHLPYFIHHSDKDWQNPGPNPRRNPYFLFVGRLEVIKGLDTLIDIWNQVDGFDLVIAGSGTQEAELRQQAFGNEHVAFLGALSQSELGRYYFHAIATIVPSITFETFGIIIVESFARKTPVIVRDLGALPEVVHDSQGGFVYQTDSELLEYIDTLANQPELRNNLGENGYSAFLRFWSPEAHLEQYYSLIKEISEQRAEGTLSLGEIF